MYIWLRLCVRLSGVSECVCPCFRCACVTHTHERMNSLTTERP